MYFYQNTMPLQKLKQYNLDNIIRRFNKSRFQIFTKEIRGLGFYEIYNEQDIYHRLIHLDVSTGFFKTKSFISYLNRIQGANVVVEINIVKSNYSSFDVSFRATAYRYEDWIRDPRSVRYITLFGEKAFYTEGPVKVIPYMFSYAFDILEHVQENNVEEI